MMRKIKNFVLLSLITVVCLFGLSAVSACTEPIDGYTIMNNYIIQPTLRYELYTLYASNAEVNGFTFSTDKSEGIVAVGDSFKKVNITNGNGILKISYDDTEIIVDDAFMRENKDYEYLADFWNKREVEHEWEKQRFSAFIAADKLFILSSGFRSVKNDGTGYVPPTLYRYDLADGKLYYNSFLQGFKDSEEVRATDTFKVRCPSDEFVAGGVKYYYENNKLYITGYEKYLGSVDTELNLPSRISNVVVKEIKREAFKGLSGVETIKLSEELEEVSWDILQDCPSLKKVTIGQHLSVFNGGVFYGSNNLEEIKVSVNNRNLCDEDGVLYTKDKKKLICYPAGKTSENFTVDDACKELSNYAFSKNESLKNLNLNNVEIMNHYAVNECRQLSDIIAPKVYFMYANAITDTKFSDETEDIILGKVLYKKASAGEAVEVDDKIEAIAAYAFADNKSVKKVVLGKKFRSISEYAFKGCFNLESVEIYNLDRIVFRAPTAFVGCNKIQSIIVPKRYLESYKTDRTKYWIEVANKISSKRVSVKYYVKGELKEEKEVDYGETLGDIGDMQIPGYTLLGWTDKNGKNYYDDSFVDKIEGIELNAKLALVHYTITYKANFDLFVQNEFFTVAEDKALPELTMTGYTFKGWHTSEKFTEENNIGTVIKQGSITSSVTLYAELEANEYTVTFVDYNGKIVATAKVKYGHEYTFPIIYPDKYVFNGWATKDGIMYTSYAGNSFFKYWNIASDTTLYMVV